MQLVTNSASESIYVCEFSTGLIKVGRGKNPAQRISNHKKRLGCAGGISLDKSFQAECHGNYIEAEAELIRKCADAATAQHAIEWFEGLSFDKVCTWAKEIAETPRDKFIPGFKQSYVNDDYFCLSDWMRKKASDYAILWAALTDMTSDQADAVFEALTYQDQFLINDCIDFANDLMDAGYSLESIAYSVKAHALDVIFVQVNFWSRGRPDPSVKEGEIARGVRWRMLQESFGETDLKVD